VWVVASVLDTSGLGSPKFLYVAEMGILDTLNESNPRFFLHYLGLKIPQFPGKYNGI
jgi:hypothetical protein